MKMICTAFFIVMIVTALAITSCNAGDDAAVVKDGTYVLEQDGTEAVVLPCIIISDEKIRFVYDYLSSYLAIGTYTIDKDELTMKTDDGKYKYVFKVEKDKLIFQKDNSSKVKLIDGRIGIEVKDNAEFLFKEK